MDGKIAILFWLMSLPGGEYTLDGISTSRYNADDRMVVSVGSIDFQERTVGWEPRFTYMFDQVYGRFNPIIDVSISNSGAVWAGVGLYQQIDIHTLGQDFFAGFTFAPGIYFKGDDVDLGYPLEFRAGVELGIRFESSWQLSLSYDHRSNADISELNPGLETLQIRLSKVFP